MGIGAIDKTLIGQKANLWGFHPDLSFISTQKDIFPSKELQPSSDLISYRHGLEREATRRDYEKKSQNGCHNQVIVAILPFGIGNTAFQSLSEITFGILHSVLVTKI